MEKPAYSRGKPFWNSYIKGRPQVPDSFFKRLYDYHGQNDGKFEDINDVGAGLGNLSVRLAERFPRVILTEPSEKTLKDAETFVKQVADDPSQFSFVHAAAEDDILAPASVDAVFTCNSMHWIDCDQALPLLAKQLTSGGTFFASFVGVPVLTIPTAQTVWQRMFETFLPEVVQQIGQEEWRAAAQKQFSGYDAIPVPEEYFEAGAIRLRLNASEDMHEFLPAPKMADDLDPLTSIGEEDEVIHQRDDSLFFETDIEGLKDIFSAHLSDPDRKEAQQLWKAMSSTLNEGKVTAFYPVSIIMATRK